jgi:hypothetical protein
MSTENLVLKAAHPDEGMFAASAVSVSAEVEHYARTHGLSGSLKAMKSLFAPGEPLVESIDVDLVRDPEVLGNTTICLSIRTMAPVSDVLEFDRRLRDSMFDAIPTDDLAHFAIRFDFD